ncbi:MAG: hypothetical protein LBH44_03995 [Treponema sp.]|jgi:hypothetical protein|nr:hypothetical protein [Treponema sp.]
MKNEKKNCTDCLHCKVSAKSTENNRLCYCSENKIKKTKPEFYWLNKKPCDEFESMDDEK